MQAAGIALLDRIGPAILIAHSQGALFGWLIAARDRLEKNNLEIAAFIDSCDRGDEVTVQASEEAISGYCSSQGNRFGSSSLGIYQS